MAAHEPTLAPSDEILPIAPGFLEAARVWGRIGILSFGGPAGQIALMHRELVQERRWISEASFLHALNFCMLLPGPEAQQLATYIGWLLHGWRGGVVAGVLFVLPGFLVMVLLSSAYALWGETHVLAGVFDGLKAAALVIVIEAVLRMGRRSLRNVAMRVISALSFLALFFLNAPFPLVVLAAGVTGYVGFRLFPERFGASGHGPISPDASVAADGRDGARRATIAGSLRIASIWALLWALPFAVLEAVGQGHGVYAEIALFFSKMAIVTFGGAYAVLSYVAQQAVEHFHWLGPTEMLDGLGLAETTPGPLVLVLSFVGFVAAFRDSGALPPLAAGVLGAGLAAWVTFIPCFLWIFATAPWIEALRANRALSGALAAISAAVTGVILNLALWFGAHVLFQRANAVSAGPLHFVIPDLTSVNWTQFLMTLLAAVLLFRLRLGAAKVLAIMAALGCAVRFVL